MTRLFKAIGLVQITMGFLAGLIGFLRAVNAATNIGRAEEFMPAMGIVAVGVTLAGLGVAAFLLCDIAENTRGWKRL